jgi:hypothetical protein
MALARSHHHIDRMSLYVDAYNEAAGRHFERDLQAWAELLSRHHATLRRPWARDRAPRDFPGSDEDQPDADAGAAS